MYTPSSLWTWAFTIVALIQAAIILSFESYTFARFQIALKENAQNNPIAGPYTRIIPTYLTLFIFGFLYQLVLVWDALRLKNTIQVIGLCLYNLGLMIYAAVQIEQIHDALEQLGGQNLLDKGYENLWLKVKPFLVAVPCILAVGLVCLSFIAWKLYDEFAWTIYKHISADLRMKRRYLTFQIYIALLKFDFFFFLGFTVQFLVVVKFPFKDPEFGLTIAAVPVTILILVMAAFFTRRENKFGMSVIIILFFCGMAYFIFKLERMYEKNETQRNRYKSGRKSLTTFAVITLILIIMTITNAIACALNFGKGLKPHISERKLEDHDEKDIDTEMPNLNHGQMPSRMTID